MSTVYGEQISTLGSFYLFSNNTIPTNLKSFGQLLETDEANRKYFQRETVNFVTTDNRTFVGASECHRANYTRTGKRFW
jgi:hypothetical protein